MKNVPGITRTLLIIPLRHKSVYPVAYSFSGDLEFLVGEGGPSAVTGAIPLLEMAIPSVTEPGILPNISLVSLNYFPIWPFYSVGKTLFAHISTKGRILGWNLDKSLKSFPSLLFKVTSTALPWDLYFFQSRNLLQFRLCVTVHCKGERRKTW